MWDAVSAGTDSHVIIFRFNYVSSFLFSSMPFGKGRQCKQKVSHLTGSFTFSFISQKDAPVKHDNCSLDLGRMIAFDRVKMSGMGRCKSSCATFCRRRVSVNLTTNCRDCLLLYKFLHITLASPLLHPTPCLHFVQGRMI